MVGYTTSPRRNRAPRHAPHCAPRHAPRTAHYSVFLHDSVYIEGATLVKERTRDRWHVRRDTVWRSRVDTVRAASHHADTRNEKKTTHRGFLWPPLSLIVFLAVFGLIGYALKRAERRRKRPAAQYTSGGACFFHEIAKMVLYFP